MQPVHQAIDPVGESRPDWEIFSALSVLMSAPLEYSDAKEIGKEIRQAIPGFGLLGPGHKPAKADAAVVDRYLKGGFQADLAQRYGLDGERRGARDKGEFTLTVGQSLFHSGKFSTHAKGLIQIQKAGALLINPSDAGRLGVTDGDRVRLSNAQGRADTPVKIADRMPEGLVFFPEHFDQELRRLLSVTVDSKTGVPCYKATSVQIQKV